MAEDTGNSMKRKLAAGELVLCMNLRLARSVDIAMVAKAGGYDALYVDMEHSPYSIETTSTICAAALGIGITPLVRVPSHDAHWSSRVLDGGAQGVIVPHVDNPAEAEAVVRDCGFPPLGRRSVMGLGPALGYPFRAWFEDRANAIAAIAVSHVAIDCGHNRLHHPWSKARLYAAPALRRGARAGIRMVSSTKNIVESAWAAF